MKNKSNTFYYGVIIGIALSALFVVFAISFLDISWIPQWEDIFSVGNTYSNLETDEITFLDVGQGDSILIHSNGRYMFVDCGPNKDDIGKATKKIKNADADSIDCLCITHWHEDHCDGIDGIADLLNIRTALIPQIDDQNVFCVHLQNVLANQKEITPELFTANEGMSVNIGDFEITVLGCDYSNNDINDRSIVLMANCRSIKFLLMGDAEKETESKLISNSINFDCDILKVGHHGSKSGTSSEFLKIATPEYAVISCGENNRYNHPDTITLERLDDVSAKVFRTDLNGDITFTVGQDDVEVTVDK